MTPSDAIGHNHAGVTDPEPLSDEAAALVGTVVDERYEIEALLGAGAMGAVYRARHVHMQKAVALKVLHRQTSERAEIVARFEREAIVAGQIHHPNVAAATDFGRLRDGSFYLVLEYVAGKSLGRLLTEEGKLPLDRALGIIEQIVSALAAAHGAGIIHRDLKPDNVMLLDPSQSTSSRSTITDGDVVKVLDFGLAKLNSTDADATQLTVVGAVFGTPQYMSPEQAAGQEVDARADQYAVGLMLYEMLTGRAPFVADQVMALLIKHMTEEAPPLGGDVPRPVRKIVAKLLQKKPGDRFANADELLEALRAIRTAPAIPESQKKLRAALASVASLPTVPAVAERFDALSTTARRASRPLLEHLRKALRKSFAVRGRQIPLWALVSGVVAALAGVWLLRGSDDDASPEASLQSAAGMEEADDEAPMRRQPAALDPALRKVVEAAKTGSDSALYALEQRPPRERSADEWLALTQAHLMRKHVGEALDAFASAIEKDELAREELALVGALRFLADDDKYAEPILDFVAKHLGPLAPDFLFDVWYKTSAKTPATTRAFELLSRRGVKKQMSDALSLALEVRQSEACEDYAALLPRIERLGDERVLTPLRELKKEQGCGASGRDDCYPCLRKDRLLDAAIKEAALRKAPRFPLMRRWRWKR